MSTISTDSAGNTFFGNRLQWDSSYSSFLSNLKTQYETDIGAGTFGWQAVTDKGVVVACRNNSSSGETLSGTISVSETEIVQVSTFGSDLPLNARFAIQFISDGASNNRSHCQINTNSGTGLTTAWTQINATVPDDLSLNAFDRFWASYNTDNLSLYYGNGSTDRFFSMGVLRDKFVSYTSWPLPAYLIYINNATRYIHTPTLIGSSSLKSHLTSGDANYAITPIPGQTAPSGTYTATHLYIRENNVETNNAAIGYCGNLLLGKGTFTVGNFYSLVPTAGTPDISDGGSNTFICVGAFGSDYILMRTATI